jgi:outer membrane protein
MKFRRWLSISFLCLNIIEGSAFCQTEGRVLTVEESIATGIHNNQELLALEEQVSIAQQIVNEAKSQNYPKIDFNFSASKFDSDFPTVLPYSFNSLYLPADSREQYYFTRFSLWQYLYAGGRYTTNLRLAEINLSQAESQLEAEKYKTIRNVKNTFYAFLVIKQKISAYENTIDELEELYKKSFSEKDRLSRSISNLNDELLYLNHELQKMELKFLNTMGLEMNTVVDISGELEAPKKEYDLNKCLAWAFQYRPELRVTQFQETIDSLKVNLSLIERYPTVTLGANYEWVGDQFPLNESNWNATINFNLPIFDGWASWARIKQRKSQLREGTIKRAQIEDQIRLEVRTAFLDYGFWLKRAQDLAVREDLKKTQEENLNTVINWLDAVEKALASHSALEWSVGRALDK